MIAAPSFILQSAVKLNAAKDIQVSFASKEYRRPGLHAENNARQAIAFRINIVAFPRKVMGPASLVFARVPAPIPMLILVCLSRLARALDSASSITAFHASSRKGL